MAAGLSAATPLKPYSLIQTSTSLPKATTTLFFSPSTCFHHNTILRTRRRFTRLTVCVLMEDPKQNIQIKTEEEQPPNQLVNPQLVSARVAEKLARKKSERFTYLVAAVMSSFGVTSMAILAVYYRFSWQMEGGEVPWSEMFGTFALSVGAAVSPVPFPIQH